MTWDMSEEDTLALTGEPPRFLRLLSDIHVDVNPPATVRLASLPADRDSILVLAGDFGTPKKLADWLKRWQPHSRTSWQYWGTTITGVYPSNGHRTNGGRAWPNIYRRI